MSTPTVIITFANARRADHAHSLAARFLKQGYGAVTVTSDDAEAVNIDGDTYTWEGANRLLRAAETRLRVPLVVLPHGDGLPLPAYETEGAAGMDLRAAIAEPITLLPGERALIPTGLSFALPDGYEAQVRPRSGLSVKFGISIVNAPGTVDSDYRGEIKVPLINLGQEPFVVERGERIAQIVFAPVTMAQWVQVWALDTTSRGAGGFGSTGKG